MPSATFYEPQVFWNPDVAGGTTAVIPSGGKEVGAFSGTRLDVVTNIIDDQIFKTIAPAIETVPITAQTVYVTTDDNPSIKVSVRSDQKPISISGNVVGSYDMVPIYTVLSDSFPDWIAIMDSSGGPGNYRTIAVLRQTSWTLNVDSSTIDPENPRYARNGFEGPTEFEPTETPVLTGPIANALSDYNDYPATMVVTDPNAS